MTESRTLAHVVDGRVRELFIVPAALASVPTEELFPVEAQWIPVELPGVAVGWSYADGTFASPAPYIKTVADAVRELDARHRQAEAAGFAFRAGTAPAPSMFSSDAAAQGKLTSAFLMVTAGLWVDGTPWLNRAGFGVPMTGADVQGLAARVAGYVAACNSRYADLLAAVRHDVDADITTGWPANQ